MNRGIAALVMTVLLVPTLAFAHAGHAPAVPASEADTGRFHAAAIYYNEACGGCSDYLFDGLIPFLEGRGITVTAYDYVNEPERRGEMNERREQTGLPLRLQSHIMTFLDGGDAIIGGHVPLERVAEVLDAPTVPPHVAVIQDTMLNMSGVNPDNVRYTVWQPGYEAQHYALTEPLATYLTAWKADSIPQVVGENRTLLPLVLWTGLLDGINPCAIAVLIFFIAFLFTLRGSLRQVVGYGAVYVAVIYLTYLGIGLGLFNAIIISGTPHLMAKIGAWLVIVLGLVNVVGYYAPHFPLKLQIPKFSQGTLKAWLTKGTLPAVIIGAFLVGLCTFPCSGGIYVAIVSLLASRGGFWQGFGYLLVYNVMFVVPLIVLLGLAANPYTVGQVAEWHSRNDKLLKLTSGLVMIALGIIILLWFV